MNFDTIFLKNYNPLPPVPHGNSRYQDERCIRAELPPAFIGAAALFLPLFVLSKVIGPETGEC
jgi:hypothetical protein